MRPDPPPRELHGGGGFAAVPLLLRIRLRMVRNAVRSSPGSRGWTLVLGLLGCGGVLEGYRAVADMLRFDHPAAATLEPLLAQGFTALAGFTAVTGVTFALGALYFARDLDMLLSAPIPARAVLLSRMGVQLGGGLCIGGVLVIGPLLAYLVAQGAVLMLPLVALVILAMAALPLALGTALTIAAVRVLPARRVRDAAGLLVTLVLFAIAATNLLLRGPDGMVSSLPAGDGLARAGTGADVGWLPTGWGARALVAAFDGHLASALAWALPLLLLGGAAPLLVARFLENAYRTGQQHSVEAGRGRRATQRPARPSRVGGQGVWRRPLWVAIAVKDLREVRRDGSQLGQLLLPVALFGFSIAAPGHSPGAAAGRLPFWFMTGLTAGFAGLFAASGLALRGIGLEGRRLWMVRSAPVDVRQLLTAKFATGLCVASALGIALLCVGGLRAGAGPEQMLAPALRLVVVLIGLCGLATGMGAAWPRLDWTDPRRSVSVGLSLTFLVLGGTYLGVAFVILGLPYAAGGGMAAQVVADMAAAALALGVAAAALRLGGARLRLLEV